MYLSRKELNTNNLLFTNVIKPREPYSRISLNIFRFKNSFSEGFMERIKNNKKKFNCDK